MASYGQVNEKLSWIFLEWRRVWQRRMLPFDLSVQQYAVLRRLRKHEKLSPHEIAVFLHADRPTATVIIKNLSKKELITVVKSTGNAKYRTIELTEKGITLVDSIQAEMDKHVETPYDILTPSEMDMLNGLLSRIKTRLLELREKEL